MALPHTCLNLPPALRPGATLGIVAPASPGSEEALAAGLQAVEAQGFRTILGAHARKRYGHLAGRDEERAADLMEMFRREDVDGILCVRGGSGSIRLLRYLDWDLIRAHPKPFMGYSDITTLELALLRKCGMPSFFAPMVASEFSKSPSEGCLEILWRLVGRTEPAGELVDPRTAAAETMVGGVAEGPCVGGTLTLVAATLGTPYEVETEGCVFFFEDVHESPARIERYLAQLLLAGKLDGVAGFLIGSVPYEATEAERARFLSEFQVYQDLLEPLGKPMIHTWPVGHVSNPVALPMGVRIRLDADRKSVTVLAPAVR